MAAGLLPACVGCGTTGLSSAGAPGGGKRSFAALSCGDPKGLIVRTWGVDYRRIVSLRLLIVISHSGRAWKTLEQAGVPVEGDDAWRWSSEPIPARKGAYGLDIEIYNSSADSWLAAASSSCRR
jgi:hypothetical protein